MGDYLSIKWSLLRPSFCGNSPSKRSCWNDIPGIILKPQSHGHIVKNCAPMTPINGCQNGCYLKDVVKAIFL